MGDLGEELENKGSPCSSEENSCPKRARCICEFSFTQPSKEESFQQLVPSENFWTDIEPQICELKKCSSLDQKDNTSSSNSMNIPSGSTNLDRSKGENVSTQMNRNENFSIKVFLKSKLNSTKARLDFDNEVKIMQQLRSPWTLVLHEVCTTPESVYLVLERYESTLCDYLKHFPTGLDYQTSILISSQVLQALNVCKENGITHRNLKPASIFISSCSNLNQESANYDVRCKLGNFSSAVWDPKENSTITQGMAGSIGYMAPEMFSNLPYDGSKSDIWSFGCLWINLHFGIIIFNNTWLKCFQEINAVDVCAQSLATSTTQALACFKNFLTEESCFDKVLRDFIQSCLQVDPNHRLSACKLLEHDLWSSRLVVRN